MAFIFEFDTDVIYLKKYEEYLNGINYENI